MAKFTTPLRNAIAYASPELGWGIVWALTVDGPMVAAYRDAFGGTESFVGAAWLIGSLAIGIPGLLSGHWVQPLRHKRAFVFWLHMVGAVVMLGTALAIRTLAPQGPAAASAVYLVGVGLFFLSVGILLPGWLALVGELFSRGTQARVLAITFIVNKVAAMVAGHYIAQTVLGTSWSATDQWSLLFVIAGVAGVVGSLPFLAIVEVPRPRPPRTTAAAYLRSLLDAVRELPALRRLITADVLAISLIITLTFYADAAIQQDGFPAWYAGRWVTLGAFAQVVTTSAVAGLGDRVHPRTWMALGAATGVGAALAAAFGGAHGQGLATILGAEISAYDLAAAGTGVYMGVRTSCHAPLIMRFAPERDGTAPIGIAVAAIMVVQGFGPPVASWVIADHGYRPVFLAIAACGAVSVLLLLLRVPTDVESGADANAATDEAH